MAGEAFRAAEAHRELDHSQRIEAAEGGRLPAAHFERECRSGGATLPLEYRPARVAVREQSQVVDRTHLRMRGQERSHRVSIGAGALHAQLQRFHRAQQHPRGIGIELCADRTAQLPDRQHMRAAPRDAAGDQIGMAADVLGQRIHIQVRAALERLLVDRAKHRVVGHDQRPIALAAPDLIGGRGQQLKIDERIGRICGRLGHDQPDSAEV